MSAPTLVPPSVLDANQALSLVVYLESGPKAFPLEGRLVVGRVKPCAVLITSTSVSREHAMFTRDNNKVFVTDCESTNGTWVNGERIKAGTPTLVDHSSSIRFGSVHAEIQLDFGRALDTDPPPETSGLTRSFEEHTVAGARSTGETRASSVAALLDKERQSADGFVADDPRMREVLGRIKMIASSNLAVLVYGETGVGKERIAAHVHALSSRSHGPYVKINCAAIPESILESELFGYERGAFTGANTPKQGLLEAADHGTLFLDEVGEMPLSAQAKLLRVLETREVTRLGAVKPKLVDVRIISATNLDLRSAIRDGRFRADLFYRLQGLQLFIPPLRERPNDLGRLVDQFMGEAVARRGSGPMALAPETLEFLRQHNWPGNVRELRNTIERSIVMARGPVFMPEDIVLDDAQGEAEPMPPSLAFPGGGAPTFPSSEPPTTSMSMRQAPPASTVESRKAELEAQMIEVEKARVTAALAEAGGNQTRAAKILGISRGTLIARIESFGLARPRKKNE